MIEKDGCQENKTEEEWESLIGEEKKYEKDEKWIMRYANQVWIPNVQELKDEIFYMKDITRGIP